MQFYYVVSLLLGLCVSGFIFGGKGEPDDAASEGVEREQNVSSRPSSLRPTSDLLTNAVARFDRAKEATNWELNQLERLAFSLDVSQIQGFIAQVEAVENPERFGPVLTALYARWAEIDPEGAAEAAFAREEFAEAAVKGAVLTWLNSAEDEALGWLASAKPESNQVLKDWVKLSGVEDFGRIAKAIEYLEQNWPEGADGLGHILGERWVMSDDWRAAAVWASEDGDVERSDKTLSRIARLRGESYGLDALEIASYIEDKSVLSHARNKIFYWWGYESPARAIEDLRGSGIPDDWSKKEIGLMANGMTGKYPELLSDFLELAQTTEQLDAACVGALRHMDRWVVHDLNPAALQMSDTMAQTDTGKSALTKYYRGLHKEDPQKAREFLGEVSSTKQSILNEVKL